VVVKDCAEPQLGLPRQLQEKLSFSFVKSLSHANQHVNSASVWQGPEPVPSPPLKSPLTVSLWLTLTPINLSCLNWHLCTEVPPPEMNDHCYGNNGLPGYIAYAHTYQAHL